MKDALIIIVSLGPASIFIWWLVVHGGVFGGYRWHNWLYARRGGKPFWYQRLWWAFRQWICFKHQWVLYDKEYCSCYRCGKLEKCSVLEKKWEKEREEKKKLEEELRTEKTPLIISVLSAFALVVFVFVVLMPVLLYNFFTGEKKHDRSTVKN